MRNPYQVLGITSRSSKEEAKARYRKLCKTYHPDNLVSGDPIKFKEVQDAWKVLENGMFVNKTEKTIRWSHKTIFTFKRR